jgi:hypothetical protein
VKRASDALFVLAALLLVLAIVQSSAVLYSLAGVALVGSIVTTSLKRRREKAAKAARI